MRLSEPIEKHGFFWLPGDAENQVPGVLRISESGDITLEVSYLYDFRLHALHKRRLGYPEESEDANIKRIVGVIDDGLITLDGCYYGLYAIKGGGVSTTTIHAIRAFIGVNYEKKEKIIFTTFTFSLEGLDEWLWISGFKRERNWEDMSRSIHFRPPPEIVLNLPDGIELKFIFSWTDSPGLTESHITQKASISLISKELRPIEDFLDLVFKLHLFFCFAIDQVVSLDSVTGYSSEITQEYQDGYKREIPIKIYYQSEPYSDTKPKVHPHDMLFDYGNVSDQIEEILTRWIQDYEISKPAFNLYFATKSGGQKYLDGKFLSLAQGIETLHRRNSQETQMPEDEFRNLIDTILNAVPDDEQKRWIDEKMKYANEISLRKRMRQMIEPFKDLFGNSKKRNSFIGKVVDTRNYLTHYDSQLESKAAHGEELWRLYRKLEALFQLHFLRLIGWDIESIKSIAKNNKHLCHKLGLEYQNPSEESV